MSTLTTIATHHMPFFVLTLVAFLAVAFFLTLVAFLAVVFFLTLVTFLAAVFFALATTLPFKAAASVLQTFTASLAIASDRFLTIS
jgi:hypothetical protein